MSSNVVSVAEPIIQPPSTLLTPVSNQQTGQSDFAFPLQSEAWVKMQTIVHTALSFPLTTDDFTNLYGTFTDQGTVIQAVGVLNQIQTTAAQYGDPRTLITQIAGFQQGPNPPDSIYGNAVWLAAQTVGAAQQIVALLTEGLTEIGVETDPHVRIQDLTDLLTGEGGVTSYATALESEIKDFQSKTKKFYSTLNQELTGPTDSLQTYLLQDKNVLTDARSAETIDKDQIDALDESIHDLNKEYIGFTVAASLAPVLWLVPFFGPVLAIADATTFAVLAAKVKAQIDDLKSKVADAEQDDQKKVALVTVLQRFNTSTQDVEDDGNKFDDAISQMIGGWQEFDDQINTRLKALTVADVQDWPKFMDSVGFKTAVDGWNKIASKAESFYQAGFVTFTTQSDSGN